MHPPSQSSRRALAGASLALALLAPWPSAAQSPVAAMRQQVDAESATLQAHDRVTPDLGGTGTTADFAEALAGRVRA